MAKLLTRLRTGPFTRWGAYWKQLGKDYAEVLHDSVQEGKNRPLKTSLYILGTSALLYGWNTSPGERQFSDQLVSADSRLRLVAAPQRSPAAEQHVRRLRQLQADGLLTVQNLGPLSVLWEQPYPAGAALHAARCPYTAPSYASAHERVRDVGAFGRWWRLWQAMRDYDVNEAEFREDVAPLPPEAVEAVVTSPSPSVT